MRKNEYKNKILENIEPIDVFEKINDYAISKCSIKVEEKKSKINLKIFYRLGSVFTVLIVAFIAINAVTSNTSKNEESAPKDSLQDSINTKETEFINYYSEIQGNYSDETTPKNDFSDSVPPASSSSETENTVIKSLSEEQLITIYNAFENDMNVEEVIEAYSLKPCESVIGILYTYYQENND